MSVMLGASYQVCTQPQFNAMQGENSGFSILIPAENQVFSFPAVHAKLFGTFGAFYAAHGCVKNSMVIPWGAD